MANACSKKTKLGSENLLTALSSTLAKWTKDEMKFHTSAQNSQSIFKMPAAEDLKELCSGPFVDVWKFAIQHVTSVQKAKHIKGNVTLQRNLQGQSNSRNDRFSHGVDDEDERERRQLLKREKARLLRDLQQTTAEISQLNRELSLTLEERVVSEQAYQSMCQGVQDLQRREAILQVAHNSGGEILARYAEYTNRVDKCVGDIADKKEIAHSNYVASKGLDLELETESCHMVREACGDINTFLHSLLESSADKAVLEKQRAELLETVERASAVNSTNSLLAALSSNTQSDTSSLKQLTAEVDIVRDAQEISFTFDPKGGGLQDLSTPQSVSESVQDLMQAGAKQHVLRWFKQQELLNEEWKLCTRKNEKLEEINKLLSRLLGDHPSHLTVAKGYVLARLRLSEERAVAPCLMKEASRLTGRIERAGKERQELKQKATEIADFQKLVTEKQAVISRLARVNAGAPDRLQTSRKQVVDYMESRSLKTQISEAELLPTRLTGALILELEQFQELLMPCLITVPVNSHTRMSALDLSTSPAIYALAVKRLQTHADVCRVLEVPYYKAVECLPLHALYLHSEILHLQARQRQREVTAMVVTRTAGSVEDINHFVELGHLAKEHDKAQCEKLIPKLRDAGRQMDRLDGDDNNFTSLVQAWWDQPAQWTTPWVRTGGLTFDQWAQRFRTLMTRYNAKLLGRAASSTSQS